MGLTKPENELEKASMLSAMVIYGGSFVKDLARLFRHADHINTVKIYDTWPEYVDTYTIMGRNLLKDSKLEDNG